MGVKWYFLSWLMVLCCGTSFAGVLTAGDIEKNSFGYIGQPDSSKVKLIILGGYRLYDSDIGQFLKQDSYSPFKTNQTFNGFNYAAGNPVVLVDQTGHMPGKGGRRNSRTGKGNAKWNDAPDGKGLVGEQEVTTWEESSDQTQLALRDRVYEQMHRSRQETADLLQPGGYGFQEEVIAGRDFQSEISNSAGKIFDCQMLPILQLSAENSDLKKIMEGQTKEIANKNKVILRQEKELEQAAYEKASIIGQLVHPSLEKEDEAFFQARNAAVEAARY